jgi:hypothetical protein
VLATSHEQQRERNQDRVLVVAVEYVRCQQPGESATDHPAKRRAEVELGQPPGVGTSRVEFAMAHQSQQREHDEIECNRRQPEHLLASDQAHRERRHPERNEANHIGVRDPWPLAEHGDESEQVDCQRHHPQEGCGSDIGGQIRGDGYDEA